MILEFLGLSRSGKSTQRNLLAGYLTSQHIPHKVLERPNVSFRQAGTAENFHRILFQHFSEGLSYGLANPQEIVVLDRGFYDRSVLLQEDLASGSVSRDFAESLQAQILPNLGGIDHGFLFMVEPVVSLSRWDSQREEGLDSAHLNQGLTDLDTVEGLNRLHGAYTRLHEQYPHLVRIDGSQNRKLTHYRILTALRLL